MKQEIRALILPYIFITCIEILSHLVKTDEKIRGTSIPIVYYQIKHALGVFHWPLLISNFFFRLQEST